jgi:aldehyde dehydrogenase (NAD+)
MKTAADRVADVSLELGGKSPFVVFPDADLESAARNAFIAIFYNTGETCTAGSRMFVHEDVYDEFVDQLVGMAEGTTPGDPLDPDTSFGPKVSTEQVDRVAEYLEIAREDGGTVLTGGDRPDDETFADGSYYEPTIIEGLDHDSRAVQEEIFGPVLEVFEWDDYDEMIGLANDVDYGLAAGVMTQDINNAYDAAKDLQAGNVWVNQYNDFPAGQPFGGVKQSGIGREQAKDTLKQYTQTKTINVSLR